MYQNFGKQAFKKLKNAKKYIKIQVLSTNKINN